MSTLFKKQATQKLDQYFYFHKNAKKMVIYTFYTHIIYIYIL